MALKLKKGFSWLLLSLFVVAGVVVQQGVVFGKTALDKSSVIDLTADTIIDSGFTADENLITDTNTLLKPYTNDTRAVYSDTNATFYITNNNWCERTNDAVDPAPDSESNSELTGLWVTMDTNYLYVAIRGQAKGRHNNLFALIDSSPNYGAEDFNSINHTGAWKRDMLFDEGIKPNVYLGFWCANDSANYNNVSDGAFGGSLLYYGDGVGNNWTKYDYNDSTTSQDSHDGKFFSWYNGSTQHEPTNRLWMFKIKWEVITNSTYYPVNSANLEIRLTVASTGPDNLSAMYDYMPETQYQIVQGVPGTVQNNYFTIPVTDAAGNLLTGGLEMNTNARVAFLPGSRWDEANDSFPLNVYDDRGNAVKAFSPNGDGFNDTVNFSVQLSTRKLFGATLKIYDLKGRLVRVLATGVDLPSGAFPIDGLIVNAPFGYTGDFFETIDSRLQWDGKDDNGKSLPIGFYVAVFTAQDGSKSVYINNALSIIR